jgi:hypothetical protein
MTTITTKKPESLSYMKARVIELEKQLSDCLEDRKPAPKERGESLEDSGLVVTPLSKKQKALIQKVVAETLKANYGTQFSGGDEYHLAKHLIKKVTHDIRSERLKKNVCIHFYRLLYKKATALHARSVGVIHKPISKNVRGLRAANRNLDGMLNGTWLTLTVYIIRRHVRWGESLERPKEVKRPATID